MDSSADSVPKTASIRSLLEEARETLDHWNPTFEMTQPVKLPTTSVPATPAAEGVGVTGDFLFENMPAMIWIKDTDSTILKVNRWAAKAMGVSAEELEGVSEWDLHPDRVEEYFQADRKVIESRKPIYGIVEKLRMGDGTDLWVVTDKLPILDREREVKGIMVITRDISNQKEAEEKLMDSQERLELALWGARMGSWDWLQDENRLRLDRRAAQVMGLGDEEEWIDGGDLQALIHPKDFAPLQARLRKHLDGRSETFECECRVRTKNETDGWRWVQLKGRTVEEDVDDHRALRLSGTVMDVSRRRKMEEEREALERQMQHAQKLESLGVLAGGIAHDFNNLLTGILSQTGIARVELGRGVGDADGHLQKIESAARRMAELTRQMLAYSGRGKFETQTFDVNEVIKEIVYLLKASIGKNALFHMELSEAPTFVEGDTAQLHQILLNIVTNASDAVGESRGRITLRTGFEDLGRQDLDLVPWANELKPGRFAFVEVEDDGCGMDEETQARLFEPFFTTKFAGRGLGLAAVLGIVRSHGGVIKVKTAPGAGTVFRVYHPAAKAPPAVRVIEPAATGSIEGFGKFLIIDDEQVVRTVFSQAIETLGFEYEEAVDGPPAIELFSQRHAEAESDGRFTGIFLDMTMPEMNGHEVYEKLQSIDPAVPVCIMSGYAPEEVARQFDSEEIAAFLPKPFKFEDIERAIRRMQDVA